MNLYLVGDGKFVDYDTDDSIVVAAHDEKEARAMANDYEGVNGDVVQLIGITVKYNQPEVILSSFNAG